MDKDLIERLAREAGFRREGIEFFSTSPDARAAGTFKAVLDEALVRFAALVAEECAKECDAVFAKLDADVSAPYFAPAGAYDCATAIRAKFKEQ
jgi:hypothetical protein